MAKWLSSLSDNIAVDKSKCTFCMQCVDKCILDNLRFYASPCRDACPLRLNCQGYTQLIARGEEEKALGLIYEGTPFPGILGRVCAAPCETSCSRNTVDGQPVATRALKRYLADAVASPDSNGSADPLKAWRSPTERAERVAIVGGGPAGVMAACYLRREGYQVSLFEASSRLGGMLTACIPEFRLPPTTAADELALVERLGVDVHLGSPVDERRFFDIIEGNDAVLVATGATRGKRLGIPGEDLAGVYNGIDFLRASREADKPVVGKRVVVVGGGNTAVDAAQTAYRLGAEEVRVVCLEAGDEMPAFAWEVRDAVEEGVVVENGWGPTGVVAADGRAAGLECRRCLSVFDAEGRFAPCFAEGERRTIPADTVIIAIGQEAELGFLGDSGLEVRVGRVVADADTLQTAVAKVFAAGDAVSGPTSVVEAMGRGRTAAESITRYLQGLPLRYGRRDAVAAQVAASVDASGAVVRPRVEAPRVAVAARRGFGEIEGTLSREQARAEAERCLSCGRPAGEHRMCWSCLACEQACPEDAIAVSVPYLMR
ncbi:MAG: FAD-dependent oxidoreductase [Dehalococcoidales bacterium]|nr:FAD-dependent oxidoreductase [Dehalococcoidales bacterium]